MAEKEREKGLFFLSLTTTLSSGGGKAEQISQISRLERPGTFILGQQSFTDQLEESMFNEGKYFYII